MPGSTVYEFTPYRLVPAQRQLVRDGTPVKLGGRAFDVLVALVERRERTVSKNELMDLVWPTVVVEENNLEVQIVTLRKLLGYAAIGTVPGRGYRFALPVSENGGPSAKPSPPRRDAEPDHNRVPVAESPLYGREEDLRTLTRLLDENAVVTVAGAGGIGKTRLAQVVAEKLQKQIPQGVIWVELSPLSDSTLVPVVIARALGLSLEGVSDPTKAVVAALRGKAALLVLDNAEHLLEGVSAFIASMRQDAARVKMLITSQEVLRTLDEHVFRPGPLALPTCEGLSAARESGAVALFDARARAADLRFELTEANYKAVVEVCRRLDGIPLAIELAAARVPLLGVDGVQKRLNERFNVLTAGARAVMRRHQTLRAALEWSHGLLASDEKIVFRRLGVFVAGFTLESAQAVVQDEAIDGWDVLEHMGTLVDKSLIVAEGDAEPRYRMLETTRLYALERLADANETTDILLRHARHYADFAERLNQTFREGGQSADLLAALDGERDNLLHALAWCEREANDDAATLGLRIAAELRHYWMARGLAVLGLKLIRTALARSAHLPPNETRSKCLGTETILLAHIGEHEQALALALQHIALAGQLGTKKALAEALATAGFAAATLKRVDEALGYLRSALDHARAIRHVGAQGMALSALAVLKHSEGRFQEAATLSDEVIQLGRRERSPNLPLWLLNAAESYLSLGESDRARAYSHEAALLLPKSDSRYVGQRLVDCAATICAREANWSAAVQLLGASRALRSASSHRLHVHIDRRHDEESARARAALGACAYDKALLEGRNMTYGDAVRLASTVLGSVDSGR